MIDLNLQLLSVLKCSGEFFSGVGPMHLSCMEASLCSAGNTSPPKVIS